MSSQSDVIIIGAPRSGTNMLRDVLTALRGYGTWNCDEINLVWRHGNRSFPSDELRPNLATATVQGYIRRSFDGVRRRTGAHTVVEKTCANSLRVEFVHRILPTARYLFITRDGLDAAASAAQRWHAPMDVRYTAAKAKYVPLTDIPYYGTRFLVSQWRRRRGGAAHAGLRPVWWGPKPDDWAKLATSLPVDEIAAVQWRRCIEAARRGLATIPDAQVHHVVYEEFVSDPAVGLSRILAFLGDQEAFDTGVVAEVTASSVGKGRASLSADARARLGRKAGGVLEELGYGY